VSLPRGGGDEISPFQDVVTVANNTVSFKSIQAYRNLIDNSTDETRAELVKFVNDVNGFLSLKERVKLQVANGKTKEQEVVADDDFLTLLLNQNGVIRLGEYYFKVDFNNEKVLVAREQGDLLNSQSKAVMSFSTSDDVLTLLDAGYTSSPEENSGGRTEFLCGGGCASYNLGIEYPQNSISGNKIVTRSRYVKAGIYFELSHHCYTYFFQKPSVDKGTYTPLTTYSRKFVMNCGRQDRHDSRTNFPMPFSGESTDVYTPGDVLWDWKQIIHAGTEGLRKIYLDTKYTVAGYNPNLSGDLLNCRY
jgi:hypothetical protein